MSICPKVRVSKSRKKKRRYQSWQIEMPHLVKCKKCGAYAMAHKVCRACGNYNGKLIVWKKSKKSE